MGLWINNLARLFFNIKYSITQYVMDFRGVCFDVFGVSMGTVENKPQCHQHFIVFSS